ncbi:MAG: HAMP domain-containing histidine kinase [Nitrospirae bacterium]|nr:HAMP domain-containing histidine kinase [Nitrospirota bacterium]
MFNSIKGQLFVGLSTIVSAVMLAIGVFFYYEIDYILFASVDRMLHSKVQIIKGLIHEEHGYIELELAEIVAGDYDIPRSGHYYKVLMDGKVLAASASLVEQDYALDTDNSSSGSNEIIYTSIGPAGETIRVVRNRFVYMGRDFTVYAAESITETLGVLHNFKKILIFAFPLGVFVLCGVSLLIVHLSLRTVRVLSSKIEAITEKTIDQRIAPDVQVYELRSLARSFNVALGRIQRAFEAEKRLICNASHEMKTPISVIRSHCDVLLQKDRTLGEYKEALESIRHVSTGMMNLVGNLLSLARLDSGALEPGSFNPVHIRRCLDEIIQLVQPLALKRNVTVQHSCEDKVVVYCDRDRLIEALLNIVENAVKYNKADGSVLITTHETAVNVAITITDTGIGIPEADQKRIFERFYRGEAAAREFDDGTGLGLSIAETIIKAHGGTICVESRIDVGSSFTVVLPARERL